MKKKFIVSWDEYHECCATVEAQSKKEAEEKCSNEEYLDFDDDVQNIDNVEICEAYVHKEELTEELKSKNGHYSCGCTPAEKDKMDNSLSKGGEDGVPSPHSLSGSHKLKGGEKKNDN